MTDDADTMKAAVIAAPREVEVRELPLPEPGPRQVRLRLEGSGVCASDLPSWEGREWFDYPMQPGKPGHEGWGRVDAVGDEVEALQRGDRVAALTYHAYATHDVADADKVVQLPDEVSEVSFPAEPLACALNIFRRSDIEPGQTVAVVGVGFLGALLTGLASRAGARVIGISRREFSREMGRRFGAEETIPMTNHEAVRERVEELTDGDGCDRVIEAVGKQEPLDLAGSLTRVRGRLVIAGYHQDGLRQVDMQMWNWRGLDVINAHERDSDIYVRGMRDAVHAVLEERLEPDPLFTHEFSLERLGDAFEAARRREPGFMKAIVTAE